MRGGPCQPVLSRQLGSCCQGGRRVGVVRTYRTDRIQSAAAGGELFRARGPGLRGSAGAASWVGWEFETRVVFNASGDEVAWYVRATSSEVVYEMATSEDVASRWPAHLHRLGVSINPACAVSSIVPGVTEPDATGFFTPPLSARAAWHRMLGRWSAACCSAGISSSTRRPRSSSRPPSRPRSRPVCRSGWQAGSRRRLRAAVLIPAHARDRGDKTSGDYCILAKMAWAGPRPDEVWARPVRVPA